MKLSILLSIFFLVFIININKVEAEYVRSFMSGSSLYNLCSNSDQLFQNTCDGYITGSVDTLISAKIISSKPYGNGAKICIAMNIPLGKIVDSVIEFLQENPQSRQYPAAEEVDVALQKYFPCR